MPADMHLRSGASTRSGRSLSSPRPRGPGAAVVRLVQRALPLTNTLAVPLAVTSPAVIAP